MALRRFAVSLIAACILAGCDGMSEAESQRIEALARAREELRPLHTRLDEPGALKWYAVRPEPDRTFEQYVAAGPVRADERHRVIYVQPLGQFSEGQRKVVQLAAESMGLYFDLPVKVQEDLPLSLVPPEARREHPSWGVKQILTTHVLDRILKPRRPENAAAYIAFTASDLWAGPGWNFVFGQASLTDRVGVWSIARNGDPDESDEAFRLCLLRTMKTGTHETAHMFSLQHCTTYACSMCYSNNRIAADRKPLALCPECMAKVCWATGADPVERCRKLAAFCKGHELKEEAAFYENCIAVLAPGERGANAVDKESEK
ncbi:MAG: archaemetzincin [Planctomycetota bacterium]|jgi:archaemetzincin